MKIAFTAKGTGWEDPVDPRFGRTDFLLIYDDEEDEFTTFDNRDIENEAHGAGPRTAQNLFESNARVLITGNGPGANAARILEDLGISIYTGAGDMTVRQAYEAYRNNELKAF